MKRKAFGPSFLLVLSWLWLKFVALVIAFLFSRPSLDWHYYVSRVHTEIFQAVYSKKRLAFLLQWSFTKKPLKAENCSLSMCSRVCKIWKLRKNWLHTVKIKTLNLFYSYVQNSDLNFEYFFDDFADCERWSGTLEKKRLQCKVTYSKMFSMNCIF